MFSEAGRGRLAAALAAAWCLVIARSLVAVLYEQSLFDSDQAIIGLMARHLAEGRAFPLFYYGQSFLLGVEAWLAVPVFWIAGASVATLHVSLMLTNLAAATLLILGLVRYGGLAPFHALAASAFFTLAPPFTSAFLMTANGANVEPFLFLLLLWFVRRRPLWFGCVLGIGFLTREFTVYAVPVVLLADAVEGRLLNMQAVRHWLLVAVSFSAVIAGVEALAPFSDPRGPGTRGVVVMRSLSEAQNLGERANLNVAEFPARFAAMAADHVPRLAGAAFATGALSPWIAWPLVIALAFALVRGLVLWRPLAGSFPFGLYVLGLGLVAAAGYIVTRPAGENTPRYYLLALFIPVGATATFLAHETHAWLRRAMVGLIACWVVVSAAEHVRDFSRFSSGAEPDEAGAIARALVAEHVTVAEADYWRAYKLTFISGERVKIAATGLSRIDEYERLAAQAGPSLRTLQDQPCAGGIAVASAFLCRP
jgi:hypothetical protein